MALAGDHVQVLVDGYELTGDGNKLSLDDRRTGYEVTAFGDGAKNYLPGVRATTLDHAGYLNAAAARAHPVLRSAGRQGVVSALLGQNAAPAVGDPVFSLAAQQGSYGTLPEVAKYVPFTARFATRDGRAGWGVALAVPVNITSTSQGSAVDHGAATARGGAVALHVLGATASDTYTLSVEGSATGAFGGEQAVLATFSLNGSALGAEFLALAGSIPRYVRWKAVRAGAAGDTLRLAILLVRY